MACGFTMNTRDLEHRFVIKFLTKEGKKPKEIHERMNAVYGGDSPSYYQVKFWSKQFKWGMESIVDYSCPVRPVAASSKQMCQKVVNMIFQYRRIKVSVIAHNWHSFQYHPFSLDDVKGQFPMDVTNVDS